MKKPVEFQTQLNELNQPWDQFRDQVQKKSEYVSFIEKSAYNDLMIKYEAVKAQLESIIPPKAKDEKIYAAGTILYLGCITRDSRKPDYAKIVLETDTTQSDLESMAKDFYLSRKEPDWWVQEETPEED